MKTSELIEQAKKLCQYHKLNTPDHIIVTENDIKLIEEMTDSLEMAYNDLRKREDCEFCMHAPECRCEYTMLKSTRRECKGWQWRGDTE